MEQKNLKKYPEYSIGLDIGTNSVGWAVTDSENNILKHGGKNMWGARLFDEGDTAAQTRTFRGTRRRIERRRERVNILQSLLLDDMEREYPNFFPMLRESSKVEGEKQQEKLDGKKYNLFSELNFSDQDYYAKYPTIYHLRKELTMSKEKHDIRLVYLAIHHIIKYRGNFLYEGDLKSNTDEVLESIDFLVNFIRENFEIEFNSTSENLRNILRNKETTKTEKKDALMKLFDYSKEDKAIINGIICAILGYKFDVNKVFDVEIENSNISFSSDITNEEEIKESLQENADVYDVLQKIYNWFVLQDILQGNSSISEAFIKKYEKYKEDLKKLKYIYKIYLKIEYNNMFRKEEIGSYAMYDKNISKCPIEELYKRIKKDFASVPDCKEKQEILQEIDNEAFLIKINTTANAAIPYQLHYQELEKILENQAKFYSTINENKENILNLMKFRIPYYVGPLAKNDNSRFAWIVRKSDDAIRPWNFEECVDVDATAEMFIRRMTNKCTYLLSEDVIPKQSILYSEFCVRNELANVRVNNHKLSPQTKDLIIEKLFKMKKTAKVKDLKQVLIDNQIFKEISSVTGLAEVDKFMSNMPSYIDMKEIFGIIDENNIEMIENIIEWITIFEDKKILKRKIEREYHLDEKIINRLAKKNYSGWSRLSKELLIGLKSFDDEKNIMEKLQSTKDNFMQIINNDQYGFNKQIEDRMKNNDAKITYEMVDEIPTSPANKRAIWQSVKIVKEITKIMKSEPKNIYVEFAREEQKKKVRKDNRAKALLKIYDTFAEEMKMLRDYNPKVYQELKKKQNDRDFNERLYLYFTQNGRCMYSSRPLNIDTLYLYEVDHILPQSYVKDDSLSNKALVYKEENQRKSGSLLLDEKIINKQELWWKQLHKNGLIDDKKLRNLTRRKMFETNDDKVKFVSRQLIETRQSIKYITNLLVNQYKDSDVFAIRAELTHNFRILFEVYKNRNVNDYHHAQDAYIISVVGNVIDTKLHFKDEYKYTEYVKNYIKKNEEEKLKDKKVWIIMGMVSNNIDKEKVKKTLNYKDCFVTRKLEEQTGEFYKQTLYGPNDKNVKPVIPLKKGMNVEKYGGYSGENKAYFTIFSYIDKKNKKQVEMIGIPVKTSYDIKNNKITLKEYVESQIDNATEVKIIKPKILKYQEYLDENNEPMVLLSDRELRTNKQLVLPSKVNKLIYLMNKEKATEDEKIEVEMNIEEVYNYLIKKLNDEYKSFSSIYEKAKDDKTKNKFNEMSYDDKVVTINGLLDLMHKGQGNLSKIGLGDRAGRTRKSAFKTKDLENMTFIDKSVTGIYERRYKVNGMENGSSK